MRYMCVCSFGGIQFEFDPFEKLINFNRFHVYMNKMNLSLKKITSQIDRRFHLHVDSLFHCVKYTVTRLYLEN